MIFREIFKQIKNSFLSIFLSEFDSLVKSRCQMLQGNLPLLGLLHLCLIVVLKQQRHYLNIKNYDTEMWMTSVLGHLKELKFKQRFLKWEKHDPLMILRDANIVNVILYSKKLLKLNLQKFAKECSELILWLDCDKEGESIAFEVQEILQGSKSGYNRIQDNQMRNYIMLYLLGLKLILEQGLLLLDFLLFYYNQNSICLQQLIMAHVKCRHQDEINQFVKQKFWQIQCSDQSECMYNWIRGKSFDKVVVKLLFEKCNDQAIVTGIQDKEIQKQKPLPLSTIELYILASRLLKLSPYITFEIAQSLYSKGYISTINLQVKEESFQKQGLIITEKNYLDIYNYEELQESQVPKYNNQGDLIKVNLKLKNGLTFPPKSLTESELVEMMDQNRIGTDSSIHEHIITNQEREYAISNGQVIKPTSIGYPLVQSCEKLDIPLHKPYLRAIMEQRMNEVAQGQKQRQEIVNTTIDEMREILKDLKSKKDLMLSTFGSYFEALKIKTKIEQKEKSNVKTVINNSWQKL